MRERAFLGVHDPFDYVTSFLAFAMAYPFVLVVVDA